MLIRKTCECCGKEFTYPHWRKNVKYCSIECRSKGLRAYNNVICAACGKPFHLKQSHINIYKGAQGFYCSRECSKVGSRIRMTGKGNHQYGLKGELNSSFKGKEISRYNHRLIDIRVYVPDHPFADKDGRVTKHRLIVEQNSERFPSKYFIVINGRKCLRKGLIVHHIDGNHSNNDIDNLAVLTKSQHTREHNNRRYILRSKKTEKIVAVPYLPITNIEFEEVEELSEPANLIDVDNNQYYIIC